MLRDLKIAIRHLSKSPGFSLTAVLTLALGIGATTAIFSIVEGVLLRPLPFPHPEQLVVLSDTIQGAEINGQNEAGVTGPDIVNYTRDTHSFAALGGYTQPAYELSGIGDPAQVNAARMTPGVFSALAVEPLLGRVFTQPEDEQHQQIAVLSYATWQSRFHGDPSILGQKILLDRKPYLVIGVMPRNFEFPLVPGHLNRSELWIPMSLRPEELNGGAQANWSYQMVGRLKPGITAARRPVKTPTASPKKPCAITRPSWPACTSAPSSPASMRTPSLRLVLSSAPCSSPSPSSCSSPAPISLDSSWSAPSAAAAKSPSASLSAPAPPPCSVRRSSKVSSSASAAASSG